MPYRFLGHTADIKMQVVAKSTKDVFVDAFYGLMNYLTPEKPNYSGQVKRLINVSSSDFTNLLIDFLNEVLASAQIHKEIYNKINFIYFPEEESSNFFVEAEIIGSEVNEFRKDIKAITYHQANLEKKPNGQWSINLVFDI